MAENPKYDDCPEYCPKGRDHEEDAYCQSCPLKDLWSQFETKAREWLKEKVGAQLKWPFDELVVDFSNALSLARTLERGYDDAWTLPTCRLVDIIRREEGRIDRIEEWERAQEKD